MSAQKLRDAAARIRETAQAATPGSWGFWGHDVVTDGSGTCTCYGGRLPEGHEPLCGLEQIGQAGEPDAKHFALWSPPVALAVADWLEAVQDARDQRRYPVPPAVVVGANAVADLILGGAR